MKCEGKRVDGVSLASFRGNHKEDEPRMALSRGAYHRIGKKLAAFGLAGSILLSMALPSLANSAAAADVGVIAFTTDEDIKPSDSEDFVIHGNQEQSEESENQTEALENDGQEGYPAEDVETEIPDEEEVPKNETVPSTQDEDQPSAEDPVENESPTPAPAESDDPIDSIQEDDLPEDNNGSMKAQSVGLYVLEIENTAIAANGREDTVQFSLSTPNTSGITLPENTDIDITGSGTAKFDPITFSAAGTYTLNVTCSADNATDFRPDERTLEIKVSVTGTAAFTVSESSRTYKLDGVNTGTQTSFVTVYQTEKNWSDATIAKAEEIMAGMTLEEKVGQCFLIHYPGDGSGSNAQAKAMIDKWHPGGFLVFAAMFNNSNPATVQNKTAYAQSVSEIPMIFSVDEEGGKVVRISDKAAFGHEKFDFPQNIAAHGASAVEADAADKALFLKNLGMTVNHAPVADVSSSSGYIYPRTYGGDGLYNSRFVAAAIRGHEENGVGTSMKHFPGYGSTSSNTHNGFAVNNLSIGDFRYNDLLPFYEGIAAGGNAVMVTHNIINCLDTEMPASLSPAVIDLLRDEMGFDGVVMTDDLNMQAVINAVGSGNASLACLKAGVDMPMTPQPEKDIPVVMEALNNGTLSESRIEESCRRVLCWKIDMGMIENDNPDLPPDPPIPEEEEASWTSLDGNTTETGKFDTIWTKVIQNGGTIKMLVDIDTEGDKNVSAKNVTLDLNGHKLHFTSGTNGFVVNGTTSTSFTITDNVDPNITTEENPANREEADYNDVRRTLVYYTMAETGIVTKHEIDMDACGGITGNNTGIIIEVKNGVFNLDGGVLTHKVRAVETINNANNVINIRGGAVVGCGVSSGGSTVNGSGIGVYGGGTLNISGGYVGGNEATTRGGGIIIDSGTMNMSGGVLAANRIATNGGAVYVNSGNTINITGGTIACNHAGAQGGGIYLIGTNSTLTVSDKAFLTMNSTDGQGGAIFSMAGWGSTGNATVSVENGLFTGNTAQNGGAIRSGSSTSNGGTVNITGGRFYHNKANGLGGAIHLYGATKGAMVKHATFMNNEANDGGAIYVDTPSVTIPMSDLAIEQNKADGSGGGVYLNTGAINMSNSTIKTNSAGVYGGGVYMAGTSLSLNGEIYISRNRVGASGNNLYLPAGKTIALLNTLGANSSVGVTTATTPTESSPVPVCTATQTSILNNSLSFFYSDRTGYTPSLASSKIVLALGDSGIQGPEIKFDGILFQYYADVTSLATTGDENRRLEIIDTTGGVMPTNGQTPVIRYLYLNEDGSVKTTSELTEIYKAQDLKKSELTTLPGLNKFSQEEGYYEVTEIWVLKEGGYPGSKKMSDWNVYPWSPELNFTTDMNKVDENTFYVDIGSVVRYVCSAVEGEYSGPVVMYDYDISDGNLYETIDDAINQTNPLSVSEQQTREAEGKSSYFHTYHSGINSDENYTGTGARFAFGNSNSYTGYGKETRDGYNFNSANRGKAETGNVHFKLCHFGLVQGLDENGHIIYNPEISVPNLFDEGTAIGKTMYSDYKLNFNRRGDQYILASVGGLEEYASGLNNFGHPGIYDGVQHKTVIWTNHFWPMDGAPSFGGDDHDPKFGSTDEPKRYGPDSTQSNQSFEMPKSDDAKDHNAYFGMQYAMAFTLTEDYVGPLEYTFFGDDDLWVFLDGKLICDIGGVHQSTGAFINLRDYLGENDYGDHELRLYYLERGASGSTCWMRFNLPHLRTITDDVVDFPGSLRIEKAVEGSDTTEEFEFTVTLTLTGADGDELADEFSYTGSKTGTLASGDTINLAAREYIVIPNLPIGTQYTVTETPTEGFIITSTGETGTINDSQSTASFLNTAKQKVGTLRISKKVIHEGENDSSDFVRPPVDPGNTIALSNMYVTDKTGSQEDKMEQIWLIEDMSSSDTQKENYYNNVVDDGTHNIYVPNIESHYANYGVMVDTLQSYIFLNAEAVGTSDDGMNNDYHIEISEYGAADPQTVSSIPDAAPNQNYVPGPNDGLGRITNARFRLNPSKDGNQIFQFTIVNDKTETAGTYYLYVFRNRDESAPTLQTHIKADMYTANLAGSDGPDFSGVRYTLYRKSNIWRLKDAEETSQQIFGNEPWFSDSNFIQRLDAMKTGTYNGQRLMTEVHSGVTDKDGKIHITPEQIGQEGAYLLLLETPGYLDTVVDNLLIYRTWAEAEYNIGTVLIQPCDLNHDGVVDEKDMDIFSDYVSQNPDKVDPVLDFDGNGCLNDGDMVHILVHWGMTTYPGSHCNNPFSEYETYLQKYTGDDSDSEPETPPQETANNSTTFSNIFVTDTSDESGEDKLNQMWTIEDRDDPMSNFHANKVDSGLHDIYVPDPKQMHYGVMVDVLDTNIYLNAIAPNTDEDTGANDSYYIVISEYDVPDPQAVDSRTFGTGDGQIWDARFDLDPAQDNTQRFKFTIVDKNSEEESSYFLTIFREVEEIKLQTWLKTRAVTADDAGEKPDHTVRYTLYRKNSDWHKLSVDEAAENLLGLTSNTDNPDTGEKYTYPERLNAVLNGVNSTGTALAEKILSDETMDDGVIRIKPEEIGAESMYLLIIERDGYLDYTIDNIKISKTGAEAEYNFGTLVLRAGDLNHDGRIDDADMSLFDAVGGVDIDGNKSINDADLIFILSHWDMTANSSCYRNLSTPNVRWPATLVHYDPAT